MDRVEVARVFNEICANGHASAETMYEFLMKVIPMYEAEKRELCAKAIKMGMTDLVDRMWEDPLDGNIYSMMHTLDRIANYLNISTDAIRRR